jgi:hypothetical protein
MTLTNDAMIYAAKNRFRCEGDGSVKMDAMGWKKSRAIAARLAFVLMSFFV